MSSYQIATVSHKIATSWYYLQKEYYISLERFGVESITINYQNIQQWNGFSMKPKWLYKAIKDGVIKAEYLLFTDSWDLVFATHPNEIMDKYLSFGADIVINAEQNMFPADYAEGFAKLEAPTKYRYLNSGFIVGKTEAILTCLEAMDLPNVKGDHWDEERKCMEHPDDQRMWQKIFLEQPVSIALDHYCILSQTLHDANINEFDFSEERIKNKVTNSYPCVFHFNGGAKSNLELRNPILNHLGLNG